MQHPLHGDRDELKFFMADAFASPFSSSAINCSIMTYTSELPPAGDLFQLFESTGWNDDYRLAPAELMKAVEASAFTVAAWEQSRLVGFGRLVSDGVLHGMIYEMMVLPEFQGMGIGSGILSMLIDRARGMGLRELQLFCAEGKIGFYRKYGFRKRPEDAPGMTIELK